MPDNIQVLLIEDSIADATLMREIFLDEKIAVELKVVRDGFEAMDYLLMQGNYKNVLRPDLILLDLNMPRKDGRELLGEIKASSDLKTIPVVILTTSQAEEDIVKSYNLNASCYVIKPIDLSQFTKIVKSIDEFWFSAVRYPKVEADA